MLFPAYNYEIISYSWYQFLIQLISISGWWLTYPSEKSWSSSMASGWHPIYEMENKIHVPNHQPDIFIGKSVNQLFLWPFSIWNHRSQISVSFPWWNHWTVASCRGSASMEGVEELSASIFRMVSSAWRHRKFDWIGWRFFFHRRRTLLKWEGSDCWRKTWFGKWCLNIIYYD